VIGRERTAWLCVVMCVATHASDNRIGAEGATALASALERNSTLQHLDVSRECRGDAGVCVCCVSCGGTDGATELALVLHGNSTLQHLDIGSQWRRAKCRVVAGAM
jgi:hypothetical protein